MCPGPSADVSGFLDGCLKMFQPLASNKMPSQPQKNYGQNDDQYVSVWAHQRRCTRFSVMNFSMTLSGFP